MINILLLENAAPGLSNFFRGVLSEIIKNDKTIKIFSLFDSEFSQKFNGKPTWDFFTFSDRLKYPPSDISFTSEQLNRIAFCEIDRRFEFNLKEINADDYSDLIHNFAYFIDQVINKAKIDIVIYEAS